MTWRKPLKGRNATIFELELEKELEESKPKRPEPTKRKLRKRDMERQALSHLEDSARTEEDFQHVFWKQIIKGDFIDAIYNCPFEMHELVTDEEISKAIFMLKDVQKELLYQLTIHGYSCQLIAFSREQTDRNIRKIRDTMLKKIRKSFVQALQQRMDNHISLTKAEQIFFGTYKSLITDKKKT